MGLMDRVSQLMTSDLGRLLDGAERPEIVLEGLLGDIEESIVDLRRETVTAVARQGRLRRQLSTVEATARRIEREASVALARGEELQARHVLGREIGTLKARDELRAELVQAGRVSARLVTTLVRMEDHAQLVRRTHDGVVRRQRAAGAGLGAPASVGVTAGGRPRAGESHAFEGYSEAVRALEREASRPGGGEVEGGGRC